MLASFARCVLQAENPRNQILPSSGGPFWGEERSRGFAYLASLFAPLVVWAPPLVGWGLGSMRQYGTCRRVARLRFGRLFMVAAQSRLPASSGLVFMFYVTKELLTLTSKTS